MDIPAYLRRIAYSGPRQPALETLRALHYAHLLAVPFENLDIHLGRPILLDEERVVGKIVGQRRGGFCYELNGLLAALLRELGFRVTLLSGRVPKGENVPGPEFDHMTLRVDLETPWLADVGFGDSFIEPLPLLANAQQFQRDCFYCLTVESERWLALRWRYSEAEWKTLYDFPLVPRQLAEFAGMCRHHQTSPESSFTQRRIVSRLTPEGRVTLANMKLIITRNGAREETELASEKEYVEALQRHFGVNMPNVMAGRSRVTGAGRTAQR